MENQLTRRNFGKGLAGLIGTAIVGSSGCRTTYVCNGAQVSQPTDGQLTPNAASYFNSGKAVTRYDPELADALNETWVREYNRSIDDRICIAYVDSLPSESIAGNLAGKFRTRKRFSTSNMRYEKEKTVIILNKMEPFGNLDVISHELRHNTSEAEYLPLFTSNRIGTMAAVHNPQFGADTNYLSFGIGHGHLLQHLRDAFAKNTPSQYHLGAFAALLALNQTNGDFAAADSELSKNAGVHLGNARTFIDYCKAQPKVFGSPGSEIHVVSTTGGDLVLPATEYHNLAVYDLYFKTAHQIIKFNVEQNGALDPATKTAMTDGMKTTVRFPLASIPAHSNNPNPSITDYQLFYQEGFTNPLSFIVNPIDYDYSIPKGQ